jgi:hypothetical protein
MRFVQLRYYASQINLPYCDIVEQESMKAVVCQLPRDVVGPAQPYHALLAIEE